MKKKIFLLVISLLLMISTVAYGEANSKKTILIVVDSLDFKDIEDLGQENYGLGFLNIKKKKPSKEEGFYFSIASGRKVRVELEEELSLKKKGNLIIEDYDKIYRDLLRRNDNIKLELLGDKIDTSFIGDDSVALIAANSKGVIRHGDNKINYNREWLNKGTKEALEETDLLVLSYKIGLSQGRLKLLGNYIEDNKQANILLIPRELSPNISYIFNKNLSPFLYFKDGKTGTLTSLSTKREAFITVEDLSHEILRNKSIEALNIGNNIDFKEEEDPLKSGKDIFRMIFNLMIIAGIFQGFTYFNQGFTSWNILRGSNLDNTIKFNKFILINMLLSLFLGAHFIHRYLIVYLLLTILLTYFFTDRYEAYDILGPMASLIYILLAYGIVLNKELIYNSFFGFNNLFYGARYYGFNNGAMGILLASSIVSFYYIKNFIKNKKLVGLVGFFIFSLNIFLLSAGKGANTGGFISSVALFLMVLYFSLLEDRSKFKKILILLFLGLAIFGVNMYFDKRGLEKSHAILFLMRIREFGFSELINMVKIKARELLKYTLMPPFSFIILGQIMTIKRLFKEVEGDLRSSTRLLFLTSIVAWFINDTGMIAFIFINQFTIMNLIMNSNFKNNHRG